jgi:hypothetical protein
VIEVSHYGLHRAQGGIAFLVQGDESSNALGLALDCPFKVTPNAWVRCNHNFKLPQTQPANWEQFCSYLDDPLFQAMLPAPREDRTPLFLETDQVCVMNLAKMSSFIEWPIYTMWMLSVNRMRNMIRSTNVQPLVIINVQPGDRKVLEPLLTIAPLAPRQLIMLGDKPVVLGSNLRRIETRLRDETFPDNMRELGAWHLKKVMLG